MKRTFYLDMYVDARRSQSEIAHEMTQRLDGIEFDLGADHVQVGRVRSIIQYHHTPREYPRGSKAPYGWMITADWVFEPEDGCPSNVGRLGPEDISKDIVERLRKGEGRPFQLYDTEGTLYYEGRIIDSSRSLAPVEDFGNDEGCTVIKYHTDRWEAQECTN